MSKVRAIIITILAIGFGGFVVWVVVSSVNNSAQFADIEPTKVIGPMQSNGEIGDHVRGQVDSPVVLVEYGDFQCSACASTHPKIDTLYEQYGDRVTFVFRNYLLSYHQNARAAATAVESAGLQGYFYQMADIVYKNQATWYYASGSSRSDIFIDLFQQVAPSGDVDRYVKDLNSPAISKKISFDSDVGTKLSKVPGTPAIYINGEYFDISTAPTDDAFFNAIREKLDNKLREFGLSTGPKQQPAITE